MQNFIKAEFKVEDILVKDQLIAVLTFNNYEGFEETEDGLSAYIREEDFVEYVLKQVDDKFSVPFTFTTIPHQNWNALWESNFEPVVVDDFCAIRAHFHPPFTNTEHEIIITPKMSFGTGHHATTYLMIEQMRNINFKAKTVADFGTGTGILAIMAEKLGAKEILAIDYDDWSIENTKENIQQNNCSLITVLQLNAFGVSRKYDVILANINKNVILENITGLINGLNTGGTILLSGLLASDENDIVTAFTSYNLKWLKTTERNNWVTIQFNL